MPANPEKKPHKPLNAYAKYSSLAIQMAVIIGGGCYGGFKLDEYYQNSTPVFTIILSLLSIGFAMYVVLKDLIKPNP
ncbi:MAG: AtpZ/AtpI family protein [Burkholderiales bacterium]|nr:AtpZ/AtpI family protein [Bacteroidia bacterium]